MKKLLRVVFGVVSVCLLWAPVGHSQIFSSVQINSSPNPVGSGARAMGMGGAFIAIADDATAASWNPGGLMQLERPEFSFVFNFDHRRKEYSNSTFPGMNRTNETYREDLNYFSVALPFRAFDKNMIISLNYQRLYDFYDDLQFSQNIQGVNGSGVFTSSKLKTKFRQSGALKAFSPAFAIQLTPRFSIGMAFNIWTDNLGYDNEWENTRDTRGSLTSHAGNFLSKSSARVITREKNENFEGFNFNFGFLWQINSVITLGAVVKTPFTAKIDRKTYSLSETRISGPLPPALGFGAKIPFRSRESIRMRMPLSYGIGLAFRFSDEFTAAIDVYRTNWSGFWVASSGRKVSPITNARRKSESHIHDTTQVRVGCEYLFVLEKTIVPLRLGAFYDPEPSSKNPDDFYGVSIGTGCMIGNIVLDCAYIYRWGRGVKGDVIGVQGTDADVDQHQFYLSMIYHF